MEVYQDNVWNFLFKKISDANRSIAMSFSDIDKEFVDKLLSSKKDGVQISIFTEFDANKSYDKSHIECLSLLMSSGAVIYDFNPNDNPVILLDNKNFFIFTCGLLKSKLISQNGGYMFNAIEYPSRYVQNISTNPPLTRVVTHEKLLSNLLNHIGQNASINPPKIARTKVVNGAAVTQPVQYFKNNNDLVSRFDGWQYEIIIIILKLPGDYFELEDIYKHTHKLRQAFPKNNSIESTIRSNIQLLRDKGILLSVNNSGKYMKNFKFTN